MCVCGYVYFCLQSWRSPRAHLRAFIFRGLTAIICTLISLFLLAVFCPLIFHCDLYVHVLYPHSQRCLDIASGHSLGGALATLAAYDVRAAALALGIDVRLTCHTFGQPRVGNHAFARDFSEVRNYLPAVLWNFKNRVGG
jgi:hypothetical protein